MRRRKQESHQKKDRDHACRDSQKSGRRLIIMRKSRSVLVRDVKTITEKLNVGFKSLSAVIGKNLLLDDKDGLKGSGKLLRIRKTPIGQVLPSKDLSAASN
jgi:hypothetical protein